MINIYEHVNRNAQQHAIDVCKVLDKCLKEAHINIYPDVFCEKLGLPTGITISMPKKDAFWLPSYHRDSGCGYFIFSISGCHDMSELYRLLIECGVHEDGIAFQPDSEFLSFLSDVDLSESEKDMLKREYGRISNTLEVRQLENSEELIAFFHTGSDAFKDLIQKRFAMQIKSYCLENNLFPQWAVEKDIYGVPLNSELGHEYRKYMDYAIKYTKLSRQKTFSIIRDKLLCHNIDAVFLNDTTHCGYVETRDSITLFRGVQHIINDGINIIAGHRETNALLLSKPTQKFIPHGVSWYAEPISRQGFLNEIERAKIIFANSRLDYRTIPSYTIYINEMKELYKNSKYLYPIINIRSYRKKASVKQPQQTPVISEVFRWYFYIKQTLVDKLSMKNMVKRESWRF